jgi:hypothetical protein
MRETFMSLTRGRSRISSVARLCAVAGLLLYPFLAGLHFAFDEAHLSGGHHPAIAMSDAAAGEAQAHVQGPGHLHGPSDQVDHRFCDFCVLASVVLPASAASISHPDRALALALRWSGDQLYGNRNRPKDGNPARAPPHHPT